MSFLGFSKLLNMWIFLYANTNVNTKIRELIEMSFIPILINQILHISSEIMNI